MSGYTENRLKGSSLIEGLQAQIGHVFTAVKLFSFAIFRQFPEKYDKKVI
ncbi:hypothetical protein [Planococcus halotolerans]|nr:hypothetical protein [Planococcus halotolerans]